MKCYFVYFLVVFALIFSGCAKDGGQGSVNNQATYRGVVIHNVCCQIVIQTMGPNYLGQTSWIDSNMVPKVAYQHVFTVSNPCQFGGYKEGDVINFRIIPQVAQTCACCMLFMYTPVPAYPIQVVP